MTYIDTITGEYPLFIGDLMLKTGMPAEQASAEPRYEEVPEKLPPSKLPTERCIEQPPVKINGVWEKQFFVRQETEEEKAIRVEEEARLQAVLAAQGQPVLNKNLEASGSAPDVVG